MAWILIGLWVVGFGLLLPQRAHASHPSASVKLEVTPTYIKSPTNIVRLDKTIISDQIPLCKSWSAVTHTSAKNGNWNDPATWSPASVPAAAANALIHHTVTYNAASPAVVRCITVEQGGNLTFSTTQNTELRLDDGLYVLPDGSLTLGTTQNPIPANITSKIIFADTPLKTNQDPQMFSKSILVWGHFTAVGARVNPAFVRLSQEPKAGDTTLRLEQSPTGWRAGDTLALPDTRGTDAVKRKSVSQYETVTVQAVNGVDVTLTAPLQFNHLGGRKPAGELVALPHVAHLSRNVVIQSANPSGVRGHVMFIHRAAVDVSNALFKDLGRTTVRQVNSTTFNADGTVERLGTNQIGRYAVHFHHLWGPDNPSNTGYQYEFKSNVVDGNLRWGIAIHATHFGLVQDNVVSDTDASAIVTEDGSEAYNDIVGNFTLRMKQAGGGKDGASSAIGEDRQIGFDGSGIWLRQSRNDASGNVMADCGFSGLNINGYYSAGMPPVPRFRGADMTDPTQLVHYDSKFNRMGGDLRGITTVLNKIPAIGSYDDNEVYGCLAAQWAAHSQEPREKSVDPVVFKNWLAWNIGHYGIYPYHTRNMQFLGWKIFADLSVTSRNNTADVRAVNSGARFAGGYESSSMVVEDCEIRGFTVGVSMFSGRASNDAQPATVRRCILENYANISVETLGNRSLNIIENNAWHNLVVGKPPSALSGGTEPANIGMRIDYSVSGWRLPHQTILQEGSQKFSLYFLEQAADFVWPDRENVSAEWRGLTNQQTWDKFGVAVNGQIAPCTDRRTGLIGFICPFTGEEPPSAPPRLHINSPEDSDIITGTTVEIEYATSGDLNDSEADHIHLQLDSNPEVKGISLTGGTHTFLNVPFGTHTVKGYIAKADHSKIAGTEVSVTFTTEDDIPPPPGNNPPTLIIKDSAGNVLANNAVVSVAIGDTLTLEVTGADADGDPLTLDLTEAAKLLFPGWRWRE